jgi:hypothetical protein
MISVHIMFTGYELAGFLVGIIGGMHMSNSVQGIRSYGPFVPNPKRVTVKRNWVPPEDVKVEERGPRLIQPGTNDPRVKRRPAKR